ncbi:hypothetical protein GCM10010469_15030 [Streptomyces labedae]|uniref:Uncharacterized protein n=1 Tax=Streptomyces labedae TaxID=285569 RepID=A0ABP6QTS4_9ACTN
MRTPSTPTPFDRGAPPPTPRADTDNTPRPPPFDTRVTHAIARGAPATTPRARTVNARPASPAPFARGAPAANTPRPPRAPCPSLLPHPCHRVPGEVP